MRRTAMMWEVFVTRFQEAFEQYEKHRLSGEEAGELLGMSGPNFRRLCVRYEEDGVEGLRNRRNGKVSPRRAPARELERMHELYRERYSDFTVKHFHEQLVKRHHYKLCYTVTKASLQAAGLVAKARRRSAHHKKRERRPLPGMLLFQDGSTHRWIATLGHDLDLVVTLDDATSAICSALLVEQEGTMSSFLGLAETIARHGLFGALYTDRGGHYFVTPKDARKVDKTQLTQVGRALSQLGITHIRPIHHRAAGAWSGCSGRCRSGCRRSCAWPASRPWRPPIATSRNASCPTTMPASRCRPPSPDRPSCPMPAARLRTCCASRRMGGRRRQLRVLCPPQPPDSVPGPSPALRPRHRARAPVSRRQPRHLRRATLSHPIRCQGRTQTSRLASCLNPLGGRDALWVCGQRKARCSQAPQAKQQQKKRTFDVLQKADIFTRYQHTCHASPRASPVSSCGGFGIVLSEHTGDDGATIIRQACIM
jgi:hypothetical protein